MDSPEATDPPPKARKNLELVPETQRKEILPVTRDYGDYLDYYSFRRKQSRVRDEVGMGRWSMPPATPSPTATPVGPHGNGDTGPGQERVRGRMLRWLPQEPSEEDELGLLVSSKHAGVLSLQSHLSVPIFGGKAKTPAPSKSVVSKEDRKPKKAQEKVYVTRLQPGKRKAPAQEPAFPNMFLYPKLLKKVQLRSRTPQKHSITPSKLRTAPGHRTPWLLSNISKERESARRKTSRAGDRRWRLVSKQEELGAEGIFSKETHEDVTTAPGRMAVTTDYNSSEVTRSQGTRVTSFLKTSEITASQQEGKGQEEEEEEEVSDYSYETGELPQSWLEDSINWQRTFSVSSVDFELLRSDWNDLRCNVSGNLQLSESEVVDVVAQYMEKLNEKNGG